MLNLVFINGQLGTLCFLHEVVDLGAAESLEHMHAFDLAEVSLEHMVGILNLLPLDYFGLLPALQNRFYLNI